MPFLVLAIAALLAFANGANDVSKAIATLVGSGVTSYRRAVLWGTAWGAAGGLAAIVLATAMLATFGAGLLAPGIAPSAAGALATIIGAALWVLVATRTGLPVSTTHAIVGSLAGVATVAYGARSVEWAHLAAKIVVPLLFSPLVAFLSTWGLLRTLRRRTSSAPDCLCAEVVEPVVAASALAAATTPRLELTSGTTSTCAAEKPRAVQLRLDHAHWLTSGATSFARALNDTPKIVALVAACAVLGGSAPNRIAMFLVVTLAMAAGSLVGGRRVVRVLAEDVTKLDHEEGFFANAVTAVLVSVGAGLGLPMSTTHVSTMAILASGVERGAPIGRKTVRGVVLAWIVTLPAAAMFGGVAHTLLHVAVSR